MSLKRILELFKRSIIDWFQSDASVHAAALAYYTIFSLAPLLILSISITTLFFSQAMVEGGILTWLEQTIGQEAATVVQEILSNIGNIMPSSAATGITLLFILYGASSMFRQLRVSLNAMWGVVPKADTVPANIITMIKSFLVSAAAVLIVGFVVLASLLLNALWTAIPEHVLQTLIPNFEDWMVFMRVITSPVIFWVIFALIFKTIPKAKIRWRDVWLGAAVTALLFWLGSYLIGLYLSYSVWVSVYGAASSLIALLIWIYYSAWILMFGAMFTKNYANMIGTPIVPDEDAVLVSIP